MSDTKLNQLIINECLSVPSTFEPNQLYLTPDTTEEDIANALKQAKEYTDSSEQDVRTDFMESDIALQTQITGLSDALDDEKGKIVAIESKVPATASSDNLLTTATDLLNATQDVRSDFAEADSELQTQITGLSGTVAENKSDITNIKAQKYGADLSYTDDNLQLLDQDGKPIGSAVEIKASGGGSNDLFDHKWADHILNDMSWLRADTFSWQSGEVYKSAYEHLVDDLGEEIQTTLHCWEYGATRFYTKSETPSVGDAVFYSDGSIRTYKVEGIIDSTTIRIDGERSVRNAYYDTTIIEYSNAEKIYDQSFHTFITYYQAKDKHKIVLPDQEANVQAIYEETGVAWYYILDVENKRFKLPRELPITDKSKGSGMTLGFTDGTNNYGLVGGAGKEWNNDLFNTGNYGTPLNTTISGQNSQKSNSIGITTDPTKSGIISHRENDNGQQYLYFYVGNYTKSAIEQTAGITTEVLNDKLDTELGNATATTKETVVGWCMPDYDSAYVVAGSTVAQQAPVNLILQWFSPYTSSRVLIASTEATCNTTDPTTMDLITAGGAINQGTFEGCWGQSICPKGCWFRWNELGNGARIIVIPLKGTKNA